MVLLDFETRSMADLKKTGGFRYAEDTSTDILCVGIKVFRGGDTSNIMITRKDITERNSTFDLLGSLVSEVVTAGGSFVAHNAQFERAIWYNVLVKKYGLPDISDPKYWYCTAAASRSLGLPGKLENVCQVLNLPVEKDLQGKRIMMSLSRPQKKIDPETGSWFREPEKYPELFERTYQYCMVDVEAEFNLLNKITPLSAKEKAVWDLDQIINTRGIRIDVPAVNGAVKIMDSYAKSLLEKIPVLSEGKLEKVSSRNKVMEYFNEKGFPLTGYTKTHINAALSNPALPDNLRELLEIRQSQGKTSTAKCYAMQQSYSTGGRVRDTLLYHGAATGRWAGRLVQFQNMPRTPLKNAATVAQTLATGDLDYFDFMYGSPLKVISSALRSFIIPSDGRKLIVADFAAIEARVLAWYAKQKDLVASFFNGDDVYKTMASVIYGKPVEEINKDERFLGKTAILGCGYGMGPAKFKITCANQGVIIEDSLADKTVKAYRSKYENIRNLWYRTTDDAINAILYARGDDIEIEPGNPFTVEGDFLVCRLPSGRKLHYFKPELEDLDLPDDEKWKCPYELSYAGIDSQSKSKKWGRVRTYGGKLVENIIQATSRDLMCNAMFECEKLGEVVLTVHDEIVVEVKPEITVDQIITAMTTKPSWATNIPLSAEGWEGDRYGK